MLYSETTRPGLGDPYWYEWSVGLRYIIDMLNPDTGIAYVELQADVQLGVDDVVITYNNGEKLFIQVKHTRAQDTLSFGDLVSSDGSSHNSLLYVLAQAWGQEKGKYNHSKVLLFTNRAASKRESKTRTLHSTNRPSLAEFLPLLKEKMTQASAFDDISFPEYESAWDEWVQQLSCLQTDEEKLDFLRSLEIETNTPDLKGLEDELFQKLKTTFPIDDNMADNLLGKLDHALRVWTTSNRRSAKISAEEVYDRLSLTQDTMGYNHNLIPNEPFFESRNELVHAVEEELVSGCHKVIFLSGIPGTGKTNIISKLCAKRDSVIDIRYYAYEPIDPAKEYLPSDISNRVDKNYFWNELFCQLRKLLRGQLYKYQVPVCNEFMTLDEKRRKFFEIVSAYAHDNGRPFILAIDGIDHAARATAFENTFLSTIPSPDYLPENIKIILAGQPKVNYPNYPNWLQIENPNVLEIKIPALLPQDISALVDVKFGDASPEYKVQLAGLVSTYAEGNTLAAIFAVYEALRQPNLIELEKELKDRKLSGNIHEYYNTIWSNAIKRIDRLFIDYKLAGIFAFFNEPVNEKKLHNIFPTESLSMSDWKDVLKSLHPLLMEKDGNYTILHNDVRVFLSSIIGIDRDHVIDVYSSLTEYYLNLPEKNEAFYKDVFRFMKAANRLNEFGRVYSPRFIIEAYVNGVELEELMDISLSILLEVKEMRPINWKQMRALSLGFSTLDQIEKSQYEVGDDSFRKRQMSISIHPFECFVEPKEKWNRVLLSDVLSLIEELIRNNSKERSKALFKRWFSGITISDLCEIIDTDIEEETISLNTQDISAKLGLAIFHSDEYLMLTGSGAQIDKHRPLILGVMDAFVDCIIKNLSDDPFEEALLSVEIISIDQFLKALLELLSENRLNDIQRMLYVFEERLNGNSNGLLLSTFMRIVVSTFKASPQEKAELWAQIEQAELSNIAFERTEALFSMYAFVSAYLRSVSYDIAAHDVLERYNAMHPHSINPIWGVFLNNVCFIGKWFSKYHDGQTIFIATRDLQRMMTSLFIEKWKPNVWNAELYRLRPFLLKAYIYLSNLSREQNKETINTVCEKAFISNPADAMMDAGFYYYKKKNNITRLQQWYNEWLGSDGRVWKEPIGDRNNIIQHFSKLLQLYDTDIDTSEAIEKARWSVIGYVSHKEYACDYLFKWYNDYVEKQGAVDPDLAVRVKDISDLTKELGDNRLSFTIDSGIFSDLFSCGFHIVKNILQDNHYLTQGLESPEYLVDGLIGYLKEGEYDQKTLLKIWAFGMSLLDWRSEDNHATIHSLQKAIELCGERSGIHRIYTELKKYGPAYIDLVSDPVRFIIPERWCDDNGERKDEFVTDTIISSYLDGEKIQKDTLIYCINVLMERGKIERKTLEDLLEYEMGKEQWGFEHNPLLAFLFKSLPSISTDPFVDNYLDELIEKDRNYLKTHLPVFCLWKIFQQDNLYGKEGLENLLEMHKIWMTAVSHFQEPTITEAFDYSSLINWERVTGFDTLFYQIIKTVILSEDADAVRTALSGLFALERVDEAFIDRLEMDWPSFHFRAKEWILMTYELLWDLEEDQRKKIQHYIEIHCADEDFNAALYANLLLENIKQDPAFSYTYHQQPYFDAIPSFGGRKMIRLPREKSWISGDGYVREALRDMRELTGDDYSDIEERTVAYLDHIPEIPSLSPLDQHPLGGCKVCIDKIKYSFLRVMYKEWMSGRWKGYEAQIARIVLSASEPFALLITPCLWNNNGSKLIMDTEAFVKLPEALKNNEIKGIIETGIAEDEIVLAGSIKDYTHNEEIFGFYLTFWDIPGMSSDYAANQFERNSRYFLQKRDDFIEDKHFNVTLHHNGIESFKDSNVSCGLSKYALDYYNWKMLLSSEGFILVDSQGSQIGHLESYYAYRNMGNRYPFNQPCLQRWIVKKEALSAEGTSPIKPVVRNCIIK